MELIIIGVLLVIGGLLCVFLLRPRISGALMEIRFMETTPIADLAAILEQLRDAGADEGSLRQYVELKGAAEADQPDAMPFSGERVAYGRAKRVRVTERQESYRDSNGRTRTRTVKHEETVSDEKTSAPAYLSDSSINGQPGKRVLLDLSAGGIKLDIPKTYDRFEPSNERRIGSSRVVGYKKTEHTIKQKQQLYVIGDVYVNGGVMTLGKPSEPKKPFIVSTKSEEELINTNKRNASMALYGGVGAAVLGVILFIVGIVG